MSRKTKRVSTSRHGSGDLPERQYAANDLVDTPAAMPRLDGLDMLRGLAMVWMAVFHFCFDLNTLGFLAPRQHFTADPFWTTQRLCIVSLFLLTAGVGQGVSGAMRLDASTPVRAPAQFWRRWAQVAVCAVLVSVGSWWMFPSTFIFFGVLHSMAVMLLLVRCLGPALARWLGAGGQRVRAMAGWGVLALLCWTAPLLWRDAFFDTRWTAWVGLVTFKPPTEDFVPIAPWFGVFTAGLLLGEVIRHEVSAHGTSVWCRGLQVQRSGVAGKLAALGRWPLSFYMLHQPVLIGLLQLAVWLRH